MRASSVPSQPALASDAQRRLAFGTLRYTAFGLIALCAWLLWGQFCHTLHEQVVSKVIPLAFKRHEAPNWVMAAFLAFIPAAFTSVFTPIISTASDRTRSRFGRRLPYIILSAPINGLCLILLGFSEKIGTVLADAGGWTRSATIVIVIGVCVALFKLTGIFVSALFSCLVNDVMPRAYLARFTSLFRMTAMLTNSFFNFFFLQYAEQYMLEILVGAGLLYLVGYTLMCFHMKEGRYPPPSGSMKRRDGVVKMVKTYAKECFFHRFYWLFFLFNTSWEATRAMLFFDVFLYRDSLGLSLDQYGKIGAVTTIITALMLPLWGIGVDRMHPLPFMRMTVFLQCIWTAALCNWLFWSPSPQTALVIYTALMITNIPLNGMHNTANLPLYMQLLPRDRYGQFNSANAMIMGAMRMTVGLAAGGFLDVMKWIHGGSDFGYRYIPAWMLFFTLVSMALLVLLHREWIKLGGKEHYQPPDPGLGTA